MNQPPGGRDSRCRASAPAGPPGLGPSRHNRVDRRQRAGRLTGFPAIVGAVIASHYQIVCAAYPGGNDGVFGTAGNPGTGAIYGTAPMTDTVHVTAGQRIQLSCNSFNFGRGTWAGEAVVEAVPVSHVH